jgi:hypothetical protein
MIDRRASGKESLTKPFSSKQLDWACLDISVVYDGLLSLVDTDREMRRLERRHERITLKKHIS